MKLSPEKRKMMASALFAGPHRSFPIEDKNHARAALIDVGRAKGLTSAEKQHIKARAEAKLHGK
jgi:hypothetical protein